MPDIVMYASEHCGHCKDMKKKLANEISSGEIKVKNVDGQGNLFSKVSEHFGGVPAVVEINGDIMCEINPITKEKGKCIAKNLIE